MSSIESERDSANTARRERAEMYIEDDTVVWANEWTWEGEDIINAYLAGSREEAEIRSEEVERLESVARGLKQCCEEYRSEIAALREFVRWHFMHHPQSWPGNAEIMPAVRRALGETP